MEEMVPRGARTSACAPSVSMMSRRVLPVLLVAVVLVAGGGPPGAAAGVGGGGGGGGAPRAGGRATVERVVDGDTIVLRGGERVRYIGMDTPEPGKPGTPGHG